MTAAKKSTRSSRNPSATVGDFDTLHRAADENAKSSPPEERRQKGAPFGQPVAEHEPPTFENKGTQKGSVADQQKPGKAHGEKAPGHKR